MVPGKWNRRNETQAGQATIRAFCALFFTETCLHHFWVEKFDGWNHADKVQDSGRTRGGGLCLHAVKVINNCIYCQIFYIVFLIEGVVQYRLRDSLYCPSFFSIYLNRIPFTHLPTPNIVWQLFTIQHFTNAYFHQNQPEFYVLIRYRPTHICNMLDASEYTYFLCINQG